MKNKKHRLLFVCTGNICRSPTAEGVMRSLLRQHHLEDKIEVDSAGTHGWHKGEAPDMRSVACARSFGVDLRDLKSRPIREEDFSNFDTVIVMDGKNMSDLKFFTQGLEVKSKIYKLLDFAPSYGEDVPDPYYKDNFDYVFEMIQVACENLLEELEKTIS